MTNDGLADFDVEKSAERVAFNQEHDIQSDTQDYINLAVAYLRERSVHKDAGGLDTAIVNAADELIQTGYANTRGLITLEALRYRIVGIIAKHVKQG